MMYFAASKFPSAIQKQSGFTLLEMAVVMVILGFLLGGLMMPLSTQRDLAKRKEAEQQLKEIHDAMIGFALTQSPTSRLPCPATSTSDGQEAKTGSNCTTEHGFVPGRTLGLNGRYDPTTNQYLDPWHRPIRYSLNNVGSWEWADNIKLSSPTPTFEVCRDTSCATVVADNLLAVIYSDGDDLNASALQNENTDGDDRFVSTTMSDAAGAQFDDILHWMSPNALTVQLVRAGRLD